MASLQGRIAIVTGAGQGIGEAITRRFAADGATVVAIDRNPETVRTVCADLPGSLPCPLDLTDHSALRGCIERVLSEHGRLDILVNNAAIADYCELKDLPLDRWRAVQAVNLEACFVLAQMACRPMIAAGYGRIINIASTQAIACEPTVGAYTAAKGGLLAMTRCLAVELAPHGVLVNAIAPGCIHTPMSFVNGLDETTTPDFQEWYVRRRKIPLGRPGKPQEIAGAAAFLAGEDCGYMTGQVMVVDGGLTITF